MFWPRARRPGLMGILYPCGGESATAYNPKMPLPILQPTSQATPQTLLRLFHQTELNWARHLGEEQVLALGTAIFNPELKAVVQANSVFCASMPVGAGAAEKLAEAQAFYREKGTKLGGIVVGPVAGSGGERLEFLAQSGWVLQRREILRLARRPAASPVGVPEGVKIIPARASFRHFRQLAVEMAADNAQLAKASMLHLDDPHVDALLALQEGRAVAGVAVLAMGEVGRIDQLYVSDKVRRHGMGELILSRTMEICARALFRQVLVGCGAEEPAALALFRKFGFEPIGALEFWRAPHAADFAF